MNELDKLTQAAEALCRAVGYDFTATPELGKMTLLAEAAEDEDLHAFPLYTLAKITKVTANGAMEEFTTPFGLVDLTAQEMGERIEVAMNAFHLRDHPEER